MRHILPIVAIACWFNPAFGAGHCRPDETTYFSCVVKGSARVVSVCGGKDWLQYRFGKPGAIELEFPQERNASLNQFQGASRIHRADGIAAQWLMFARDGTEYSVSQMEGGSNFHGVSVLPPGSKKTIDLSCDGQKPAVFKLEHAVPLVPEGNP
jgi:hypothetical protein